MTVRLTAALTALAALAAGLVALVLAAALTPAPTPVRTAPAPAVHAVPVGQAPAADGFLAALAPGADLDPAQAAALTEAADRVCEGLTAGVPVASMSTELMGELHLTGDEAMRLVNTAATTRCASTR